jgi:hypothetical protein
MKSQRVKIELQHNAFNSSAREIFNRSLDSSNEDIFYSNLSGKVTSIFFYNPFIKKVFP